MDQFNVKNYVVQIKQVYRSHDNRDVLVVEYVWASLPQHQRAMGDNVEVKATDDMDELTSRIQSAVKRRIKTRVKEEEFQRKLDGLQDRTFTV
jgi:hypothetical protein